MYATTIVTREQRKAERRDTVGDSLRHHKTIARKDDWMEERRGWENKTGRWKREREREREERARERGAEVTRPTPKRERGQTVDDKPYQSQQDGQLIY